MTSTLLVTGGAGFVGSHLVDAWIGRGGRAVVLDDLSTGRRENLFGGGRASREALEFVPGSVLDEPLVRRLCGRVDRVAHLASVVGVARVVEHPGRTQRVIEEGSRNVLSACADHGLPILMASSSEVYGASDAVPLREDGPLLAGATDHARFVYARSKLAAEQFALEADRRGAAVWIARLFNTTGPRQDPASGMVLPALCARALAGEPLKIYGDGLQTRSFAHVEDVALALLGLFGSPRGRGLAVNVGAAREISMLDLARRVLRHAGSDSPLMHEEHAVRFGAGFVDPPRRVPDLSRLAALFPLHRPRGLDALISDTLRALLEAGPSAGSDFPPNRAPAPQEERPESVPS